MKVELTEHELTMLDFYRDLPEDQQLYCREIMATILAGIQDEMKPLVRQVLISMSYSGEQQYPAQ